MEKLKDKVENNMVSIYPSIIKDRQQDVWPVL